MLEDVGLKPRVGEQLRALELATLIVHNRNLRTVTEEQAREAEQALVDFGLIVYDQERGCFVATDRGDAHVEYMLSHLLPVATIRWQHRSPLLEPK